MARIGRGGLSVSSTNLIPTLPGLRANDLINTNTDEEEWLAFKQHTAATFPEFLIYRELTRRRLKEGEDFDFQSAALGGKKQLGGAVIDFILYGYIAGRVQGLYWHFRTIGQKASDIIQRAILEGTGYTVVDMLEDEIIEAPSRVARLLIDGRETGKAQAK